ncbi:Bud site selection protein bud4 [Coemansia sp. BCRC 34301]|nr:Bud site selection protein bud4 [Coemansia sp. BCRC 34301]
MPFRHQAALRNPRRASGNSDSSFDDSEGEDLPESIVGAIEIPKSPSHPASSRVDSTPGMKAPSHINFSSSLHSSPRHSHTATMSSSAPQPQPQWGYQSTPAADSRWPPHLYRQWFGAITEGRSIQVHSILADHPDVLNMRRKESTPFHMALTHIASEWLGNDTSGMDGLQVAIMGYKNAYANWRLGNGAQTEQMAGMSADQMKEHVAVREVILGALIDAISPEQLDSHFFGRQQNSTLHLAAFYNDANLVERLLRQGAAIDIPNRMGFLPTGITNDKPTLQWLSMYRGQLRGTRYELPIAQQDSDSANYYAADEVDDADGGDVHGSAMSQPLDPDAHFDDPELEMEMLEQFSDEDDDACETSYIRRFGNMSRSPLVSQHEFSEEPAQHRSESRNDSDREGDDNVPDNASVNSSCDRGSLGLGLGGSKSSLTKKSPEAAPLRQRVLEGQLSSRDETARPASRGSTKSGASDMAYGQLPLSSVPSVVSYHTANSGADVRDDEDEAHCDANATVRIKVDPNSIDDDQIDDIFSDSDDIVQHEPSYCHTGSGLSGNNGNRGTSNGYYDDMDRSESPTKQSSIMSSMSSSGSITMQSLSNALSLASGVPPREILQPSISAFPVVLPEVSLRSIHELSKPSNVVDQLKRESVSKDSAAQKATSPFLLRDSLYEMIMGRSPSRQSGASLAGSVTSNTISNGSTFGSSKDNLSVTSGGALRSPTSPTTHISPTSTSFDDSNCSPSHTAISSPSGDTAFANLMNSASVLPESVPEESAETATGSFADDALPVDSNDFDDGGFDDGGFDYNEEDDVLSEDAISISVRSASPVPGPRPTAESLFAPMHGPSGSDAFDMTPELSDDAAVDVDVLLESEHERAALPLLELGHNGAGEQFPPTADVAFHAGRIGRRQGRAAAAELMHDDFAAGFGSESTFSFAMPKAPAEGVARADAAVTSEGEPESPLAAMDSAGLTAPDAPLTRDKRDQYLQTLINRNTMRGSPSSSPSKRSAHAGIAGMIRAASPAWSTAASDAAAESGEDGDNENDSLAPPLGYSFRNRHISKRSEGSIDFGAARSSSSLGMRDRSLEGETPRNRPPSSLLHTREALSGASINGRMRASTMNVVSPTAPAAITAPLPAQQQTKPVTPTRKVSPSLAVLKNRNLVSNSPAKLSSSANHSTEPSTGPSPATAVRVLTLSTNNRVRAMSTPPDSRPPSSLLPAKATASGSAQLNINMARIGRVAALSQTFEKQQGNTLPHRISIPVRPDIVADNLGGHSVAVSAPLGGHRSDLSKPIARSTSISSSHSTGAHGQSTVATRDAGSESAADAAGGGHQEQQQQDNQHQQPSPPPPPPAGGDVPPGGYGAGGGEGGDNGNGGDEPSPNPRAMALEATGTDSNGSTTSHNSSLDANRGLAGSALSSGSGGGGGLSAVLLMDSNASADIGSSIFSSTESSKDAPPVASSPRRDAEAERKSRFKELANRRKSGTLERISNSGLVKSRKALLSVGEPAGLSSSPSSSSSSSATPKRSGGPPTKSASKVRFVPSTAETAAKRSPSPPSPSRFRGIGGVPEVSAVSQTSAAAFFELAGEGRRHRDSVDDNNNIASLSSSVSSADLNLDGLQQASTAAFHPGPAHTDTPPRERVLSSRQSSSGGGSGGDDSSLHILSSFDTLSTPESTPLDSALENTHVGLLAQYNMNQKRMDYRLKRVSAESEQSYLSSGQNSQLTGGGGVISDDIDLGFRTIGDEQLVPSGASGMDDAVEEEEDKLGEVFHTLLPSRPRYNPRALFGLSTVAEEEEESRNASMVASDVHRSTEPVPAIPASAAELGRLSSSSASTSSSLAEARLGFGRGPEMQERRHETGGSPVRGLRSAMFEAMVAPRPRSLSLASMQQQQQLGEHSEATQDDPAATHYDDHTQSRTPSLGSHSFDPNIVFGYNSEENSTMASRSSFDRSDVFSGGRPSSAGSRVLYMHPMDQAAGDPQDGGYVGDSECRASRGTGNRPTSSLRWHEQHVDVAIGSTGSIHLGTDDGGLSGNSSISDVSGKGKGVARGQPEMQQIQPRVSRRLEPPATTVEAIEEDLSTDEEPIPKILFVESQDFEGYRPVGFHIQEHREEMRKLKRSHKEAAKQGIALAPYKPARIVSPLWFMENNYLEPLPPDLHQMMLAERDICEALEMGGGRHETEHPELKRELETTPSTISLQRLRSELDATVHSDSGGHGTIKVLTKRQNKRARTTGIAGLFPDTDVTGRRKSFLDSVDIPVSEAHSSDSDESVGQQRGGGMLADEAFGPIISQEFQVSGHELYRKPLFQGPTPRKRLVLRGARTKTFSERVIDEINEINVTVRTDVHGSVRVRSAGKFGEADGTVRPASVPRYVSALSGVPAGPFFQTPQASATAGYLYMRILSIEDVQGKPDSVYFVIRNGIDTLATTPVGVGGATGTTVNQEFRILTDPSVSITMWMRFRSDAVSNRRRGSAQMPGCLPPLLRKLVRRNTRSRTRGDGDSVFDFNGGGGAARRSAYPERSTSAAYGDARSQGATQAASSVFYEGLAQSRVSEETRGVAVVHVGEMLGEVFLRGLVDSWDVENVWESQRGARVQLQLFFIPECPLFREDELPRTLSECEMAMEVCGFHNRTLNSGFMSQRGGDTRFWRRRYFRLVGGFLFAYHETSRAPRCFIDLNDATRVVDHAADRRHEPPPLAAPPRRRPTHARSSSDHESRRPGARFAPMRGHDYASDSEPADQVDVADPALLQREARTDSGIVSLHASNDFVVDPGIQHSFSIEFGEGGFIEFYTESENEKRVWVEVVRRLIGAIPKIPSWLIKLLHADVSHRIGASTPNGSSESSIGSHSNPSSRFRALTHPHTLL